MRRGGCWTTRNEKKVEPTQTLVQTKSDLRAESLSKWSITTMSGPSDRVCSACWVERPSDFLFHIRIKHFPKPQVGCSVPCLIVQLSLNWTGAAASATTFTEARETTVRQRYNRRRINPHDREDYNQHTAELAACITTVFVSNLMLLPSALAHGRINLKLFSASFRKWRWIARRIHTFYCICF